MQVFFLISFPQCFKNCLISALCGKELNSYNARGILTLKKKKSLLYRPSSRLDRTSDFLTTTHKWTPKSISVVFMKAVVTSRNYSSRNDIILTSHDDATVCDILGNINL